MQVLKKEATNLVKTFSGNNKSQFGNSMFKLNGDEVEYYSIYESETFFVMDHLNSVGMISYIK